MPTGVFRMAFKFKQDPTEAGGDDNGVAALQQNLGDMIEDAGQAGVRDLQA